MIAGYRRSRI